MSYYIGESVYYKGEVYEFLCYRATMDLCIVKKGGIQLLDIPVTDLEKVENDVGIGFDWERAR